MDISKKYEQNVIIIHNPRKKTPRKNEKNSKNFIFSKKLVKEN